jgi:Ni/Co efflux regulator RcnB
MNRTHRPRRLLILLLAGLVAVPAFAKGKHGEHDEDDKRDKRDKHDKQEKKARHGKAPERGAYFDDRHRDSVHRYYASHEGKSCPPGLAKKHNGCMPPGQAKKQWSVGEPLPRTVVQAPVPRQIIVTLPPPPAGHKYVQVSGDILLVAVGSMMVVDGINGMMNR